MLFNDTCSQSGHPVSCMTILFSMLATHQIRHQATRKVGSQPGDCILLLFLWSFSVSCSDHPFNTTHSSTRITCKLEVAKTGHIVYAVILSLYSYLQLLSVFFLCFCGSLLYKNNFFFVILLSNYVTYKLDNRKDGHQILNDLFYYSIHRCSSSFFRLFALVVLLDYLL